MPVPTPSGAYAALRYDRLSQMEPPGPPAIQAQFRYPGELAAKIAVVLHWPNQKEGRPDNFQLPAPGAQAQTQHWRARPNQVLAGAPLVGQADANLWRNLSIRTVYPGLPGRP